MSLHKASVNFRWSWTLLPFWSSVLADTNTVITRRSSLAASVTSNTVQNSNLCVWLCPWVLSCLHQQCLHPSRRHFWSGKSSFGRTPRQEHSSADGFSMLQPQPSGTRFHHSSAHHRLIVDRAGLKTHLFTQVYRHLWELLLKSVVLDYITLHTLTTSQNFIKPRLQIKQK